MTTTEQDFMILLRGNRQWARGDGKKKIKEKVKRKKDKKSNIEIRNKTDFVAEICI